MLEWVRDGVRLEVDISKTFQDNRTFPMTSDQQEWTEVELQRLLDAQEVREVPQMEVEHISPIFLVPKPGPKKWRLVVDMRGLNQGLSNMPVKFETLETLARLAGRGYWMITFDLMRGYHHVKIQEASIRKLAFKFKGKYFVFLVLPFGLKLSPAIFTKIVRETVKIWRRKGILVMVYVDDFVVLAASRELLLQIRDQEIAPLLDKLGWHREPSKGMWEPTQVADVLGLTADLLQGCWFIPKRKVESLMQKVKQLVTRRAATRREISQVAGSLMAVKKAAPLIRVYCREMFACIGGSPSLSWDVRVEISQEMKADLLWILENLSQLGGGRMWKESQVLELKTDASDNGWGAEIVGTTWQAAGRFPSPQQTWHIQYKEMQAFLNCLQSFPVQLQGRKFRLGSDSWAVVGYLTNGGGQDRDLNTMIKQAWAEIHQLQAELVLTNWIHGATQNQIADQLSRWEDWDDWQVTREVFLRVEKVWGCFSIDRFADNHNRHVERFNSRSLCPYTEAEDAFSRNWKGEWNWIVPPFRLIFRCLEHLIDQGASGVMVVPQWEAQPWWPVMQLVTVRRMYLGKGREVFLQGPSGHVEPWGNDSWNFWAVWVDGQMLQGWRSP